MKVEVGLFYPLTQTTKSALPRACDNRPSQSTDQSLGKPRQLVPNEPNPDCTVTSLTKPELLHTNSELSIGKTYTNNHVLRVTVGNTMKQTGAKSLTVALAKARTVTKNSKEVTH